MFLCHGPLSKDKLGSRPLFDKISSRGSQKEYRSVVDLVSNGTEVNCMSVQNVNGKRHHPFSNWKHFQRIKL